MGLKFAKQGLGKAESSDLTYAQLSLINCITKRCYIRNWVSKHRRRLLVAGYDLDMSYIIGHILAMSLPAETYASNVSQPSLAGEICAGYATWGALQGACFKFYLIGIQKKIDF